ncbi:MAG: pilus assembly protein PilM [bacterium]
MNFTEKHLAKTLLQPVAKRAPGRMQHWKSELLPHAGDFVAIEFDRFLVKQIHIEKNGSRDRVRDLKVKFFSSDTNQTIAKILHEHLQEMGLTQNIHATISLPRRSTHTKILRLPSQDPHELQQLAANYMQKEIPLPGQEIVCDFRVIAREDAGYSRVMVMMARKKDVERYLKICQDVGLIIDAVRLNVEATYQAFMNAFQHTPSLHLRTIAIVDVDFSATNVIVIYRGNLAFSRTLGAGVCELMDRMVKVQDIYQYENWIDELATGVEETLAVFADTFDGSRVDEIVMSGWLPRVKTVLYRMQENLEMPVDWFDPSISLRAFSEAGIENVQHQWFSVSALVGMALAKPGTLMDLRPSEFRHKQRRSKLVKKAAVTALLCAYLLALIFGVMALRLGILKSNIDALQAQITALKPQIDSYKKSLQVQQAIKQELGSDKLTASLLAQIFEKLPATIELTSLTFTRGDRIIVRGTAKKMANVIRFSEQLSGQPDIETASIASVNRKTDQKRGDSLTFEMKIVFKSAKTGFEK